MAKPKRKPVKKGGEGWFDASLELTSREDGECNVDCALDFLEGNEKCMKHDRTEVESIRSIAIIPSMSGRQATQRINS